mmetsp:Transcript_17569/g.47546  ORF Transcript_17569/g.47546 Transcript_17569/m.47546 type:complete len:273 (+) Transcript_17569:366-1184(+)
MQIYSRKSETAAGRLKATATETAQRRLKATATAHQKKNMLRLGEAHNEEPAHFHLDQKRSISKSPNASQNPSTPRSSIQSNPSSHRSPVPGGTSEASTASPVPSATSPTPSPTCGGPSATPCNRSPVSSAICSSPSLRKSSTASPIQSTATVAVKSCSGQSSFFTAASTASAPAPPTPTPATAPMKIAATFIATCPAPEAAITLRVPKATHALTMHAFAETTAQKLGQPFFLNTEGAETMMSWMAGTPAGTATFMNVPSFRVRHMQYFSNRG